ncbi:hypothetical protein BSKO_00959 [Bryopsis sp. KO-2023]|nr:hypothetical protein BSKO_00959 [Bryopsis sp. KO-2023]
MVSTGGVLEPDSVSRLERRLNVSTSDVKPAMVATEASAVTSRVEAFLTTLSKAQEELKRKPSSEVDMERVDASEPHIEMILDCGVVDLLNEEAVQAAERAIATGQTLDEGCRGSPIDSNTDSDESETDECGSEGGETKPTQKKPEADTPGAQQKRRKLVEEL